MFKAIHCQMIRDSCKRFGHITPCVGKHWDTTFTVEVLKGKRYLFLWFNTDDNDTHILKRELKENVSNLCMDTKLVRH